jgi:hypothetical protein
VTPLFATAPDKWNGPNTFTGILTRVAPSFLRFGSFQVHACLYLREDPFRYMPVCIFVRILSGTCLFVSSGPFRYMPVCIFVASFVASFATCPRYRPFAVF